VGELDASPHQLMHDHCGPNDEQFVILGRGG
jgi:hypothetical protein